ncbi:hypothetical protein VTJ83DRAFT_2528 [Remersonia thermophila]|uniref:Uncharacterized protein n=1 Tax=Remersonia thermophila TaxID=72144 RepID=A0ABR4DM16_9PEZI
MAGTSIARTGTDDPLRAPFPYHDYPLAQDGKEIKENVLRLEKETQTQSCFSSFLGSTHVYHLHHSRLSTGICQGREKHQPLVALLHYQSRGSSGRLFVIQMDNGRKGKNVVPVQKRPGSCCG